MKCPHDKRVNQDGGYICPMNPKECNEKNCIYNRDNNSRQKVNPHVEGG